MKKQIQKELPYFVPEFISWDFLVPIKSPILYVGKGPYVAVSLCNVSVRKRFFIRKLSTLSLTNQFDRGLTLISSMCLILFSVHAMHTCAGVYLSTDQMRLDSVFVFVCDRKSEFGLNIYIRCKLCIILQIKQVVKMVFSLVSSGQDNFFQILSLTVGSPLAVVSPFDPTVFIYTVFLSHIPS